MARLLQGILGGISGKIGNVIGSSWKGIPVIKSKPLSVANPKTTAQVAQRTKMTNVVAFSQQILAGIIKPLWDRFAQQASGYNDFVSANIALFAAEYPVPLADMIISKGKMVFINPAVVDPGAAEDDVVVNWSVILPDAFAANDDDVYLLVMNDTQKLLAFSSAQVIRSAGTETINLPDSTEAGDVLVAYLAFRRADGTIVSDTGFATVTIA